MQVKKTVDEDCGVKDSSDIILVGDVDDSKSYDNFFNKSESDLFKEEDNVKQKLISVKRVNSKKNGESWNILENNKVILNLPGDKFSTKEKEFLRTVDGVLFLMSGYKLGWDSLNKFKKEIKVKL
jgi:hypothetical protein